MAGRATSRGGAGAQHAAAKKGEEEELGAGPAKREGTRRGWCASVGQQVHRLERRDGSLLRQLFTRVRPLHRSGPSASPVADGSSRRMHRAATFGPQAQAFITSTQARMSLALTPPRASFWTCALSRSRHPPHSGDGVCGGGDLVAFGADGKLFTMRVREQGDTAGRISAHGGTMRTYKTGSDVFALDVLENDAVSHVSRGHAASARAQADPRR